MMKQAMNLNPSSSSDDDDDDSELQAEMLADAWLDTAIASKKSGLIEDCIEAHVQRMAVCPRYKTTDAIRLLGMKQGLDAAEHDDGHATTALEISRQGLFEADDPSTCRGNYTPTARAEELGKQVKELFFSRGYRLDACQSFLLPHIKDLNNKCMGDIRRQRIFSSQSFLQHRHDIYEARSKKGFLNGDSSTAISCANMGELETLVWMFLFGLAIHRSEAVEVLGSENINLLLNARLLRSSPIEPDTMLVAEVQIYPVDIGAFMSFNDDCWDRIRDDTYCIFATDWNIESLRQTHNAIMPVGYDTLELLALTAGEMVRQQKHGKNTKSSSSQDPSGHKRILDLCCGCGIQGIFAWRCYTACMASKYEDTVTCKLVLADINERAMHFVTANLALNNITFGCDSSAPLDLCRNSDEDIAFGVCGDLFEPVSKLQSLSTFDFLLCNPPFVAIPSPNNEVGPNNDSEINVKTPLYGVGGGLDGMLCFRHILQDLYTYLSNNNPEAMAFVVTEVPNVEDSPAMLKSFLRESEREQARIRVAYIEDDVETTEAYAKERQIEDGVDHDGVDHEGWLSSMINSGIHNRALVLISFARKASDREDSLGLFKFEYAMNQYGITSNDSVCTSPSDITEVDPVDEEDMFLHPTGMDFARTVLLFQRH